MKPMATRVATLVLHVATAVLAQAPVACPGPVVAPSLQAQR